MESQLCDIEIEILGECLLISNLQGKALRTLVDIARFGQLFNMRSQSLISKDANLVFCLSVYKLICWVVLWWCSGLYVKGVSENLLVLGVSVYLVV